MESHTIELDDIRDHLTLTGDEDGASWPEPRIELDVKWHPAEPDVGIFEDTPEIVGTTYWLNDEQFTDDELFVAALLEVIGDWIEEGEDHVLELIRNRIANEEIEQ